MGEARWQTGQHVLTASGVSITPVMIRSRARRLGAPFPRTIENHQLMLDEHGFGNDRTDAAGSCNSEDNDEYVDEKNRNVAHAAMLSNPETASEFGQSVIRHGHHEYRLQRIAA